MTIDESESRSKRSSYADSELVASIRTDRRAVAVGTVVTAVATIVLFVVPETFVEEMEAFKLWYWEHTGRRIERDNPLGPVRFFGGAVGGAMAGWLASDLGSGAVAGAKAAVYGLVLMIVIVFVGLTTPYLIQASIYQTPLLFHAVFPTIYAMLLLAPHLLGGALAGAAAERLRERTREKG